MLDIEAISVRYGMIQALSSVSLQVRAGQIVSLIGSNGAGKSSLINAVSGVVPIEGGRIVFEGQRLDQRPAERIVAQGVVQVPEGRQIFANMTVFENLQVGAYSRRRDFSPTELDRVFELFPRLAERRDQLAGLMSGGEQQMLAISRAMMAAPRLLLLDEPSMGLAPLVVKSIFNAIKTLNDAGVAVLLVEQNARAAMRLSDHTYILTRGRISRDGSSEDLLTDPEVGESFLGKARPPD